MNEPDPTFPHPRVHLVAEVDLTRGQDPLEELRQQTAGIPAGAIVEVRLPPGWPAIGLDRAIAGHLFLVASEINVRVPAGFKGASWFSANVRRYVREMRAEHAAFLAGQHTRAG